MNENKHLLIDGMNLIYRSKFAARSDEKFIKSGHHPVNVVMNQINSYYLKFLPKEIHVFWDTDRETVWRRQLDESYKGHRLTDESFKKEIKNLVGDTTKVLKLLPIRQYFRLTMEADDLIYAFCRLNFNDRIIIVSNDRDMTQIPYQFDNVKLYSPAKAKIIERPKINPVFIKSLMGDKSDNVYGYHRVGEMKAAKYLLNSKQLASFFKSDKSVIIENKEKKQVFSQKFFDNLKIIDLSLCPFLVENMQYILHRQTTKINCDIKELREVIIKNRYKGLLNQQFTQYQRLMENET